MIYFQEMVFKDIVSGCLKYEPARITWKNIEVMNKIR